MVNNVIIFLYHEGSLCTVQCTHSISLEEILVSEDCLKQGDSLPPPTSKFSLEYVIRRVHANQENLKLNGTHQLVVYPGNVSVLGGSVHCVLCIKKNTEALVVASKETSLEVNAEKFKYTWSLLEIRIEEKSQNKDT